MFRGGHPDLDRVLGRAVTLARDLGHPRVGRAEQARAPAMARRQQRLAAGGAVGGNERAQARLGDAGVVGVHQAPDRG